MAYIPIQSHKTVDTSAETSGIPSNTQRNFVKSAEGIRGGAIDYIAKISPTGDFQKVVGTNAILTSIRNLLLTPLGTYPFDPLYGSLLHTKVFLPANNTTAEEIKFEVTERIVQFDDRVQVRKVITEYFNNKKGFRISVYIQRENIQETIDLDITEDVGFSLEEG